MTKERRKFEACYKLQIVKMVKEDGIAVRLAKSAKI